MNTSVPESWEDMLDEPGLSNGLENINLDEPKPSKERDEVDGETEIADNDSVDGETNLPENEISRIKQIVITKSHQVELRDYARAKKYQTDFSYETLTEAVIIEHEARQALLNRFGHRNVEIFRYGRGLAYLIPDNCIMAPMVFGDLSLVIRKKKNDEPIFARIRDCNIVTGTVCFSSANGLGPSSVYSIDYETSRYLTNAFLHALYFIKSLKMEKYFLKFNDSSVGMKKKRNIKPPKKWFNSKIGEDEQQKKAVTDIMTETAYPYPFVITGGPGTGKTSIIVESVLQILTNKSFASILITCQSNAACDEIAIRLRRYLDAIKIFRFYPPGKLKRSTPNKDCYFETLQENSTFQNGSFRSPRFNVLERFKVIIITMSSAPMLIYRGFKSDHFDFIFVDECCAATEPECLIPIVGLGMGVKKVNANIVLIGDDQLLGPILMSRFARSLGLEQSLLERMLRLKNYGPSSKRIARLTNNYRLHPEIYKYSDETFYNSSMVSMVSSEIHNFAMKWIQLPNQCIPIIFDHVEDRNTIDGISIYNLEEVEKVFKYVENLLKFGFGAGRKVTQEQIGVATPYLSQVKQLRERLEVKYPRIDIGTTEFFQGREKPVMIISAVRTAKVNADIDFLDNPRRLNVLLTRAKSLMIIVGNMEKLKKFSSWKPFIEHCVKNGVARKGEIDAEGGSMERIKFISMKDSDEDSDSVEDSASDEVSSDDE